jgi:ethanolamine utilization protein EutN
MAIAGKAEPFRTSSGGAALEDRMILARVLGNIVATRKNHRYDNASIMLCQQVTPEGDETATTVIALNTVDAGVGDTVLIVQEGWSASTASTGKPGAAIDSAIVGVVDYVDLLKDE